MIEHRPAYHFQPPADWMNDPKPFFWEGAYHVFFQYSPGSNWDLRHWGHTVSRDLVHWEQLPIALTPDPTGPDKDGCWTGCVVQDRRRFHIFYTGVHPQVQCLASSSDLISWRKYEANPVVSAKPEGFGECFRDPCVWKESAAWHMVIGSQVPDGGGAALLYESSDLIHWRYCHPLFLGDPAQTGAMFECPDFFPLGERHVLLSSYGKTHWHIGTYADRRFRAESVGMTDGGHYYAAKTLRDDRGRRIIWGWITEDRPLAEQKAAGWSGVLSMPRVLSILPDGTLGIQPVPELEALRGGHWHYEKLALSAKGEEAVLLLDGPKGDCLEILAQFSIQEANEVGITVLCSPDRAEGKEITYYPTEHRLLGAPLPLSKGEKLTLRIYVDRSVIEAFANGRACQTDRFYRQREDSLGIGLFCREGRIIVESLDVWEMKAIKP